VYKARRRLHAPPASLHAPPASLHASCSFIHAIRASRGTVSCLLPPLPAPSLCWARLLPLLALPAPIYASSHPAVFQALLLMSCPAPTMFTQPQALPCHAQRAGIDNYSTYMSSKQHGLRGLRTRPQGLRCAFTAPPHGLTGESGGMQPHARHCCQRHRCYCQLPTANCYSADAAPPVGASRCLLQSRRGMEACSVSAVHTACSATPAAAMSCPATSRRYCSSRPTTTHSVRSAASGLQLQARGGAGQGQQGGAG